MDELSIDLTELTTLLSSMEQEEKKTTEVTKEQERTETVKEGDLTVEELTSFLTKPQESQESGGDNQVNLSQKDLLIQAMAMDLYSEGLLEPDEEKELEEVKSFEDLSKLVAKTIKKNEFKDLSEEQRQYLKGVRVGIEPNEIVSMRKSIDELRSLDINQLSKNQGWQKQLVTLNLEEKGIDEEMAKVMAENLIKSSPEEFYKMSLTAKKDLETLYNSRIEDRIRSQEENRSKEEKVEQEKLDKMKSKLLKSEEIIPGLRLNDETKNEIWKSITRPTSLNQNNPLNEVMEKYQKDENYRINLHTLHVLTKGFTNFEGLEKKFQNKVTKKIDQILESDRFVVNGNSFSQGNPASSNYKNEIKSILNNL